MDWLIDPFRSDAGQQALAAGVLTAVTTAVVGTWVVLRGMAFFSDALAHAVVPGLAVAAVWGFDPTLGAIGAAVVTVGGIQLVRARTGLPSDTSIGLLFVGMLAAGVMILSRSGGDEHELLEFLFGDVLDVDSSDLAVQVVAAVLVLATVVLLHRAFLALAVQQDKAALLGLRPGLTEAVLLALVAIAVVASFRTVGSLLVSGLLIAPPAAATLVARRVPATMVVAVGLALVAVVTGLVVSHHAETSPGATIVAVAVAEFFLGLAAREMLQRARPRLRPAG